MKKILSVFFISLVFIAVPLTVSGTTAFGATTNSIQKSDSEKSKALKAGFTEQQFEQIMSIPKLKDTTPEAISITNPQQTAVVNKAKEQIGKPYQWGASGPNAFDCGGLVKYVYKQAVNVDLPMGTTNQEKYGKDVNLNALQPGDLLYLLI